MIERESKSKQMIITVETQTGKIVKVVDENNKPATELTEAQRRNIYQNPDGLKYLGVMLYRHSSPGCVTMDLGGTLYEICW